jgi:hypothetical protein
MAIPFDRSKRNMASDSDIHRWMDPPAPGQNKRRRGSSTLARSAIMFTTLPNVMRRHIMQFLDNSDRMAVAACCREVIHDALHPSSWLCAEPLTVRMRSVPQVDHPLPPTSLWKLAPIEILLPHFSFSSARAQQIEELIGSMRRVHGIICRFVAFPGQTPANSSFRQHAALLRSAVQSANRHGHQIQRVTIRTGFVAAFLDSLPAIPTLTTLDGWENLDDRRTHSELRRSIENDSDQNSDTTGNALAPAPSFSQSSHAAMVSDVPLNCVSVSDSDNSDDDATSIHDRCHCFGVSTGGLNSHSLHERFPMLAEVFITSIVHTRAKCPNQSQSTEWWINQLHGCSIKRLHLSTFTFTDGKQLATLISAPCFRQLQHLTLDENVKMEVSAAYGAPFIQPSSESFDHLLRGESTEFSLAVSKLKFLRTVECDISHAFLFIALNNAKHIQQIRINRCAAPFEDSYEAISRLLQSSTSIHIHFCWMGDEQSVCSQRFLSLSNIKQRWPNQVTLSVATRTDCHRSPLTNPMHATTKEVVRPISVALSPIGSRLLCAASNPLEISLFDSSLADNLSRCHLPMEALHFRDRFFTREARAQILNMLPREVIFRFTGAFPGRTVVLSERLKQIPGDSHRQLKRGTNFEHFLRPISLRAFSPEHAELRLSILPAVNCLRSQNVALRLPIALTTEEMICLIIDVRAQLATLGFPILLKEAHFEHTGCYTEPLLL